MDCCVMVNIVKHKQWRKCFKACTVCWKTVICWKSNVKFEQIISYFISEISTKVIYTVFPLWFVWWTEKYFLFQNWLLIMGDKQKFFSKILSQSPTFSTEQLYYNPVLSFCVRCVYICVYFKSISLTTRVAEMSVSPTSRLLIHAEFFYIAESTA